MGGRNPRPHRGASVPPEGGSGGGGGRGAGGRAHLVAVVAVAVGARDQQRPLPPLGARRAPRLRRARQRERQDRARAGRRAPPPAARHPAPPPPRPAPLAAAPPPPPPAHRHVGHVGRGAGRVAWRGVAWRGGAGRGGELRGGAGRGGGGRGGAPRGRLRRRAIRRRSGWEVGPHLERVTRAAGSPRGAARAAAGSPEPTGAEGEKPSTSGGVAVASNEVVQLRGVGPHLLPAPAPPAPLPGGDRVTPPARRSRLPEEALLQRPVTTPTGPPPGGCWV